MLELTFEDRSTALSLLSGHDLVGGWEPLTIFNSLAVYHIADNNNVDPGDPLYSSNMPALVGLTGESAKDYWLDLTKPSPLLEWALEVCDHGNCELQSLVVHEIPRQRFFDGENTAFQTG